MRAHASNCIQVWLPGVTLSFGMAAKNPSRPEHSGARLITREQQDAWYALLFAHASVTDRIDRVLQEQHGLSFSAVEILCRLHDDDQPQSLRSLADQLV